MSRSAVGMLVAAIGVSAAVHAAEPQPPPPAVQMETSRDAYVPGLGEIMAATQMRHAKLWFAGAAGNWELAAYELDEIKEGLEDAVKYHPVFKEDVPIAAMLDKFTAQPLADIGKAVESKNRVKFRRAFDSLTMACNACHRAAGHSFIVIKRPVNSPFSNQVFPARNR